MGYTKRLPFFTEYAEDQVPPPPPADETPVDEAEVEGGEDTQELEIVVPEDLSELGDEDLANLHSTAAEAFTSLYGENGEGLTEEGLAALSVLTQGLQRVQTELDSRSKQQAERTQQAQALAEQAGIALAEGEEPEHEEPAADETVLAADPEPESEAPKEIRVNLSGLRSRQSAGTTPPATPEPVPSGEFSTMRDIVKASPEFSTSAEGLDWDEIGTGLDRRLAQVNRSQWEAAREAGRHMRNQMGVLTIRKPFTDDRLVLKSTDPREAERVMSYATQETRLPKGSLVASGGWCAPSQTIYDLLETESRDGLYSLPEIGITRGGINHTPGPSFADIFGAYDGFQYTEANDIAGNYAVDANGIGTGSAGSKPCYHVTCPTFSEDRLDFDGLCLTAGLLEQRGYPEVIARTVRGVLVAHDHRIAGRVLAAVITGSTAVTMPASQVGATAPLLTSIELQVEHYRYVHRLARSTSLEAVFPYWVHGAIRADLARRLGVDMISVPDSRIDAWFRDAGVAPQFVYNFDDLTGAAGAMTSYPTTVRFVLYAAGTWVRGTSDIITLDTIYDSVLLGTNDYIALFTEEGWLVAMRGHDSRVVSVNICPDGATHGGVDIDCDGSIVAVG